MRNGDLPKINQRHGVNACHLNMNSLAEVFWEKADFDGRPGGFWDPPGKWQDILQNQNWWNLGRMELIVERI
jgi:hypothetical protein